MVPLEPKDTETRYLGPIDRVEEHRTSIVTSVTVPRGGTCLLDAGPDPERPSRRILLEVRVN